MAENKQATIALFGLFGVNNLGNEATLAATIAGLKARRPDVRVILISDAPSSLAGLGEFPQQIAHDVLPITPYVKCISSYWMRERFRGVLQLLTEPLRWLLTRRRARDVDLLVIAGTGIADDYYQGPFDVPHDLQRWCSVVRSNGGAVKFLSIGAGPVQHPLSVRWFRSALNAADYRSYREHSSKRFAMQIGVDVADDPVLPDMVFSLPVTEPALAAPVSWPPRTIGIGVMGYFGWNVTREVGEAIYGGYIKKLRWLLGRLLETGYAIHLVVGTRGADQRPITDLLATPEFVGAVESGVLVATPTSSYLDVLREIAKTDLLIATRFHNVLFGLLLERPVISVEYAAKNTDLMVEMGLAEYCHFIEDFDELKVLAQFKAMAQLPEPPLHRISERLAEYRKALSEQYDTLVASL